MSTKIMNRKAIACRTKLGLYSQGHFFYALQNDSHWGDIQIKYKGRIHMTVVSYIIH
jgi:hypothetical protein